LHDWLQTLLELLIVQTHGGADGRLKLLMSDVVHEASVEVESRQLVGRSCDAQELLLEGSLLMSKVIVSGNQFVVQGLIHILCSVNEVERWGSKDVFGAREVMLLLRLRLLVVVALERVPATGKIHSRGSLRDLVSILCRGVPAIL
jgi:hypothetical protein